MIGKVTSDAGSSFFKPQVNPGEKGEAGFKDTLRSAIGEINELQQNAGKVTEQFVNGEISDLHTVMIEGEKARIGMELMLEIRNKLVEGYQEIMRMQL